jgi:prolyl-tRNA synthetase
MFMPTRKEDPADAEIASHKLLIRGGYVRQLTRGIYSFLPLGWKSIKKIQRIVREEMDRAGAQEILMPGVQPSELWQESGRWEDYGPELLRFQDRKGGDFCLGPTHEEVITDLVRGELNSYKQLPLNLYQIQSKFRDEPRPRFGLLRGREFIMKDAYSFDLDEEGAEASYEQMYEAYGRICDRLGFDWRAVEADTGAIGGEKSHEFQVVTDTGEDKLVSCPECGYAANIEKAELPTDGFEAPDAGDLESMETVETPGKTTIEEVCEFLDVAPTDCVKTLLYEVDDQAVAVLVRGDHSANDIKVRDFLRDQVGMEFATLEMADDGTVYDLTGASVGYAGPVGLDVPIYADNAVREMANFVVGANADDTHRRNVNWERDFDVAGFADLREAEAGDPCPECGTALETSRGIEVGHVFYLGTKYSDAMDASVQTQDGVDTSLIMGCYGMGITRILAAVAEQNHDDQGLIWPMPIAPYHATVLPLQMNADEVVETGERLYEELQEAGVEVMIDDRDEGVGAKFKDADLIGIPVRVAIGTRGLEDGNVELKLRDEDDDELVPVDEVVDRIVEIVDERGA